MKTGITHLSLRIDKPGRENETLDETWKVAENIHQAIRSWGKGGREMGGGPINLKALPPPYARFRGEIRIAEGAGVT